MLPYPDELLLLLLLPDPLEELLPELPDEELEELPEVGDLLDGAIKGAPDSQCASVDVCSFLCDEVYFENME